MAPRNPPARKTSARKASTGKTSAGRAAAPKRRPRRRASKQLSLSARGSHGGWRAGAGRKRIPRDKRGYVPHITRPKVSKNTPVHVTLRLVDGLPSLRRRTHQRIIEKIFTGENRKGFRLIHYSIQGNHLHLICEGNDTQALSRGIQRVASLVARRLNKRWERRGKLFRERFDGEVIATPKQMRAALRYVLLNVHKHFYERHLEITEGVDPYSSGAFFDGWRDATLRGRPPDAGPVVPARSWLLQKGWRKHGTLTTCWV